MKLQQDQIWKTNDASIQILQLERLAVEYKAFTDPETREGARVRVTKKEFCRLIKRATLEGEN